MVNRRFQILAVILLASLAIGGCREQTIEGKWKSSDGRPITLEFKPDGAATWTLSVAGQNLALDGRYTYERGRLKVSGFRLPALAGAMLEQATGTKFEFPQEVEGTVSFKSDKEIVIGGNSPLNGAYTRMPRTNE